jgi:ATP-binding cassette subfamily F protein uup
VHGYLSDFLFLPERASSPVKALSGGERNRLLIARLFTRPANVLVLDEPTNDLDIETLELLEEQLAVWTGTLLLVSHDRAFLDNVVTSTLAFEGHGRIQEYVGGYEDWLRQRPAPAASSGADRRAAAPPVDTGDTSVTTAVKAKKLTYKEQRELEALPQRIESLEDEERALNARVAGAGFYKEGAEAINVVLGRIAELQQDLASAYARWDELDARHST